MPEKVQEQVVDYSKGPVLRGDTYCSEWCGGQCKRSDYDAAVVASEALARRLGSGWTPCVWENLGWYCSATKGVATVYPPRRGGQYTAIINCNPCVSADADTPEDALGFAMQEARTNHVRLGALLNEISND